MISYSGYYGYSTDSPANSSGKIARILNNTQTDNLNWGIQEVNQATRELVSKYYFNERQYKISTGTQVQFYNVPPQLNKIINATVQIGSVTWLPIEAATRNQWDKLNVIPFYQDYPSNFFLYNNQVGFFPIPSTGSNTITINYKTRIPDLSQPDVSNGTQTVLATNGSTTITATIGTISVFNKWMANTGWIRIPSSTTDSANGDNQWYQIASFTSGTQIVLTAPYQGTTATAAGFTIGDFSMLPEDYQDIPLYRMAVIYYTTRYPDPAKAQLYQKLWDDGVKLLDETFGSKTTSIVLPDDSPPLVNPGLFQRGSNYA